MPAQPPKPGHAHLQIRDVPKSDLRALKVAAALAEPPTTTTQLIRDLIHARAMQQQANGDSYRFDLVIIGIDRATAESIYQLIGNHVENAHGILGGGFADEPPNA